VEKATRVEGVVSEVIVERAVKFIAAALGRSIDNPAADAAKFREIAVRLYFEFAESIHIRSDRIRAREGSIVVNAIESEIIAPIRLAIDGGKTSTPIR
jgi:hypothetical protein